MKYILFLLLFGTSLMAQMNVQGNIKSSQLSGAAASATTDTTNASNISSGSLSPSIISSSTVQAPFLVIGSSSTKYIAGEGSIRGTFSTGTVGGNDSNYAYFSTIGNALYLEDIFTNGGMTYYYPATTSIESTFGCYPAGISTSTPGNTGECGIFLYDSTNSHMVTCEMQSESVPAIVSKTIPWVVGANNPGTPTTNFSYVQTSVGGKNHMKLAVSGGKAQCSMSTDGGSTFFNLGAAVSVGTITQGGFYLYGMTKYMEMSVFGAIIQ